MKLSCTSTVLEKDLNENKLPRLIVVYMYIQERAIQKYKGQRARQQSVKIKAIYKGKNNKYWQKMEKQHMQKKIQQQLIKKMQQQFIKKMQQQFIKKMQQQCVKLRATPRSRDKSNICNEETCNSNRYRKEKY